MSRLSLALAVMLFVAMIGVHVGTVLWTRDVHSTDTQR